MSKVLWVCFATAGVCLPGWGQGAKNHTGAARLTTAQPSALVPAAAQSALAEMVLRAAVIFAGHVLGITHGEGFVDVTFRIDEPVRGGSKLGTYVLREWAGLWDGQPARYRMGERLLMLLTARGTAGMSAPVGGDEGIIPIVPGAVQPLADTQGVAPAEDGSVATDLTGMVADLRWVQARALRTSSRGGTGTLVQALSAEGTAEGWSPVMPVGAGAQVAAGQPTVATVLAMLRTATGYTPGPGSGHEAQ